MKSCKQFFYTLLLTATVLFSSQMLAEKSMNVSILCYHNFNPTTPGSMNLTLTRFEEQLKWLKDNGFTIVPLKEVVEYLENKRQTLPAKAVVITNDDGWRSVYTYMYPIVKKHNIPVTLFIYPQTISKGKNAMTWEQLKELQASKLFDIQSHTNGHPNFKQAKKRLSPSAYEQFVKAELVNSKKTLEDKLGIKVTLLAWPFGIYDPYLEQEAKNAGYTMAFTIDYQPANKNFRPMAQPRFMMIQAQSMKTFEGIVNRAKTMTEIKPQ